MARRGPETLADYLVVAISPALIMLLVGSLVFFLIEVFYQGQYQTRLLFVMAMFVMAIVCVARISMEQGAGYAALFGLPLAIVTAIALARFVEVRGPAAAAGPLLNWGLMALIWWSAHKLTWDCTLIDDSQDASGHGLLQEIGFDRPAGSNEASATGALAGTSTPLPASGNSPPPEATTGEPADPLAWWRKWFEADRRPHAPGLWVVYFSLAALPLFGVGGWFIPASAVDVRQRAFLFLVVYVAAGLTLLLSTSFLGLRRYLRQRKLEIPLEMTATWVGVGLVLIVATLLVCALLPRPDGVWELANLPIEFTSPDNRANRVAAGPEGAKDDPSQPSNRTAEAQEDQSIDREGPGQPQKGKSGGDQKGDGKSGGSQNAESGKSQSDSKGKGDSQSKGNAQNNGKSGDSKQGDKSQGDKSSGDKNSNDSKSSEQTSSKSSTDQSQSASKSQSQQAKSESEPQKSNDPTAAGNPPEQPPPPRPSAPSVRLSSWSGALAWLLRAAFYLGLLIAVLVLAFLYRERLVAAWQKLMIELRQLWERWFGKKTDTAQLAESAAAVAPPKPFAAFSDPFASGAAGRMSWAELVRYTFQALEAFARERGCPRADGQTPHEFASALGRTHPTLSRLALALADWYGQLAYASRPSAPTATDPLRQLWQGMRSGQA